MHNITLAGENSILIYFGNKINAALPSKIALFSHLLKTTLGNIVIDMTPSYTSLHISYDLNKITYQAFINKVEILLNQQNNGVSSFKPKIISIPVYYDTEVGPDLNRLLLEKNLDIRLFIKIHTAQPYLVYAIGFSPVFAYLGEVNRQIQMPRLTTPRVTVPAGSVAIADNQTAIYPTGSSGGWNIIGRTSLDLSLNNPDNINKFQVGDAVQFHAITRDEYLQNGGLL
ncbi:MAG: allophanate hydrolase subunit 1 [Gammaproteobacteria bacterium]|nr:allophanate hydrolase subunit 1 [Gammaproteobacteria bacterium]